MSGAKEMELEKKIDRILSILENDSAIGKRGLVSRVDVVEEKVSEIEVKDRIRMGKAGIIGGFITAILLWLGKFILKLI